MRLEPPSEGVHGPQELPQDSSHRFELSEVCVCLARSGLRVQGCLVDLRRLCLRAADGMLARSFAGRPHRGSHRG
jgi:hypothetical protein